MKPIRTELHIDWDDGVTVEVRYFPSIRKTKEYIKQNGVINYRIEKEKH
jgi:hypothetical protein